MQPVSAGEIKYELGLQYRFPIWRLLVILKTAFYLVRSEQYRNPVFAFVQVDMPVKHWYCTSVATTEYNSFCLPTSLSQDDRTVDASSFNWNLGRVLGMDLHASPDEYLTCVKHACVWRFVLTVTNKSWFQNSTSTLDVSDIMRNVLST